MGAANEPITIAFISILAAYAARDLSERVSAARGRVWLAWLVVGATVDGIGTWSMHYTELSACYLPLPASPSKLCPKLSLSDCA